MKNVIKLVLVLFTVFISVSNAATREEIKSIIDINNDKLSKLDNACSYANYNENCSSLKDSLEISTMVEKLAKNLLLTELTSEKYKKLVYHTYYVGDDVYYSYNDTDILKTILVGYEYGFDSKEYNIVKDDYLMEKMSEKMDNDQRKYSTYDHDAWYFTSTPINNSCSIYATDNTPSCRSEENKNESTKIINDIVLKDTLGAFKFTECYDLDCDIEYISNNFVNSKVFAKHFGESSSITSNSIILNVLQKFSSRSDDEKLIDVDIKEEELRLIH